MNDENRKISLGGLEWGVIVSLLLSAGTTLFAAGILYGDIKDQDRRLTAVEAEMKGAGTKLAGIEANVQFLVNRARDEDNRR